MKVNEKDVDYVAALAHLELTPEERTRMVRDLNNILSYIDTMNELDTSSVAPMAQTADKFGTDPGRSGTERVSYVFREDANRPSLAHDIALANAPEKDGAYFKVPKVIEK